MMRPTVLLFRVTSSRKAQVNRPLSFFSFPPVRPSCRVSPLNRATSFPGDSIQRRSFARVSPFDKLTKIFGLNKVSASDPSAVAEVPPKKSTLKILRYPHPKLREENVLITVFDDSLQKFIDEMLLAMYQADGIGLAAPQVGINKRLMVFNPSGDITLPKFEKVLINPFIVAHSNETELGEEGCLSFPHIYGDVRRYTWIDVEYQDRHSNPMKERFEGKPAIIFQHEYDHLDKVLLVDRLEPEDKIQAQPRIDRLIKKYGVGGAI